MAQGTPPGLALNGYTVPTMDNQPSVSNFGEPHAAGTGRPGAQRADTNYTMASMMSVPPEGSILTGKQEHCEQHNKTRFPHRHSHVGRPQARTHLPANTIRNLRTLVPHRPQALRRTLSLRRRRSGSRRLGAPTTTLHIRQPCAKLPIPGQGQRERVLARQAAGGELVTSSRKLRANADDTVSVVPRILRKQGHLLVGRPSRRDQTKKAGPEGREAGRAYDGLWHPHRVWLRGEDTLF